MINTVENWVWEKEILSKTNVSGLPRMARLFSVDSMHASLQTRMYLLRPCIFYRTRRSDRCFLSNPFVFHFIFILSLGLKFITFVFHYPADVPRLKWLSSSSCLITRQYCTLALWAAISVIENSLWVTSKTPMKTDSPSKMIICTEKTATTKTEFLFSFTKYSTDRRLFIPSGTTYS